MVALILSLAFALFGPGAAGADACPFLYDKLASFGFEEIAKLRLPARIPIRFGKAAAKKIHAQALAEWRAGFDAKKLKPLLERIAATGKASPEELEVLKTARKPGSILRSVYKILDGSHDVPDAFSEVVRQLGEVADGLILKDRARAKKEAAELQKDIRRNRAFAGVESFTPATPRSLRLYLQSEIDFITRTLAGETATGEDFHNVRKSLRSLQDVLRLTDSADPRVVEYLGRLQKAVGKAKDDVQVESHAHGVDLEENVRIRITPEARGSVAKLLSRLEV